MKTKHAHDYKLGNSKTVRVCMCGKFEFTKRGLAGGVITERTKATKEMIDAAPVMLTALQIVKRGYEPYSGYIMTMVDQAIKRATEG